MKEIGIYDMKFTKKEITNAFLLYLDDSLPNFECEKIQKEGNSNCHRCDICMMEQYLKRVKNGEIPKIIKQNNNKVINNGL